MEKAKKQNVKVWMKNKFVFEGWFVSRDERFLQLINFKDGKLKIINLDEIVDMEMEAGEDDN